MADLAPKRQYKQVVQQPGRDDVRDDDGPGAEGEPPEQDWPDDRGGDDPAAAARLSADVDPATEDDEEDIPTPRQNRSRRIACTAAAALLSGGAAAFLVAAKKLRPSATGGPPLDAGPPVDVGSCRRATSTPSPRTHALPVEGSPLSRIAFGSCFIPEFQTSDALWRHMRETFRPELFVWLGDNMYLDTMADMDAKRRKYSAAREDPPYAEFGPIAEPKIPVTGTWDDHDFGVDNLGKEYPCLASSQAEFAIHFGLPESDPRHPAQGRRQRNGVYSSHMFARPGGTENGVHVINMDARSHRSSTYAHQPSPLIAGVTFQCEGSASRMLGPTQWSWLENEMLNRKSVVKLIGSGTQVLPPTHRGRSMEEYCAYDGPGGTFESANADIGESDNIWDGTKYEGWAEVPQERTRLLRLAQRSIEEGQARHVIFLTGDQHWAEIHAKRMPPRSEDGQGGWDRSPILYSVTASGIDQNYIEDVPNSNRVRVRSADRNGDGVYLRECNFPFVLDGSTYDDCADVFGTGQPGCSTETDGNDIHVDGMWGNCLPPEEELVPRDRMTYGRGNKCTDNYHHTCSARANYGGIVVDWDAGTMNLTLFTPHEAEKVASSIEIDL